MAWSRPPIDFSFTVLKDADNLTKKIAGAMLQGVVLRSPVDSGAFRGNHRVGVNHINVSYDIHEIDKGGNGTIQKGLGVIEQGGGIGKVVYISNSLPYALRLENGWSKGQAPHGVYAITFQSVLNRYR